VFKGTIEGIVRLADGAELPRIENMRDGSPFAMVAPPPPCSPLADEDFMPVTMTETRELRDIHIALTGMSDYPDPEPRTHEVYISDCRLTPRLLGVAVGDSLRITNRSAVSLLPVFTGESFMQAVLPEASRVIKVEKAGASRLACTFGAFCGRTEVLVTAHPLFAVSDAKGHFVIRNVPLDQDLTVHAWHPFFKDSTALVRLTATEPKHSVELVIAPSPVAPTGSSAGKKSSVSTEAAQPAVKKQAKTRKKKPAKDAPAPATQP
jgi:hypothetical protein